MQRINAGADACASAFESELLAEQKTSQGYLEHLDREEEYPHTPRAKDKQLPFTPMPFVPSWNVPEPVLLKALRSRSPGEVERALEQFPEAAREPFWDHDVEPPLCAAIRFGCSPDILDMLHARGADPEVKDAHGCTAAQILEARQGADQQRDERANAAIQQRERLIVESLRTGTLITPEIMAVQPILFADFERDFVI